MAALFLEAIAQWPAERIALQTDSGNFTYGQLREAAQGIAHTLASYDLQEARVLMPAWLDWQYVASLWGIWQAGGVAVPFSLGATAEELSYLIADSQATDLVCPAALSPILRPLCVAMGVSCWVVEEIRPITKRQTSATFVDASRKALMIYTSGTTGKPKGAVHTHAGVGAQIQMLVQAWAWKPTDKTLLTLPLHHIHGLINVLSCGLWAGATVVVLPKFEANRVWEIFAQGDLTVFMAVPTIYSLLVEAYQKASPDQQDRYTQACQTMRLMVSGSAALPVTLLNAWQAISGHFLLERYGMTEIGMAISNPLHGIRKAGTVGVPLPQVAIRLVDEAGQTISQPHTPGEIQVKSPCMFAEYWQKPENTAQSFTSDGWFKTGDVAQFDEEGYYKILGRNSTDIIKSGGYKLSALEIEGVFLQHPNVAACAVVGLPDERWGEIVAMAVVVQPAADATSIADLLAWGKTHLANYKLPKQVLVVDELPKNAMGKVVKNDVKRWFVME